MWIGLHDLKIGLKWIGPLGSSLFQTGMNRKLPNCIFSWNGIFQRTDLLSVRIVWEKEVDILLPPSLLSFPFTRSESLYPALIHLYCRLVPTSDFWISIWWPINNFYVSTSITHNSVRFGKGDAIYCYNTFSTGGNWSSEKLIIEAGTQIFCPWVQNLTSLNYITNQEALLKKKLPEKEWLLQGLKDKLLPLSHIPGRCRAVVEM